MVDKATGAGQRDGSRSLVPANAWVGAAIAGAALVVLLVASALLRRNREAELAAVSA